LNLFLDLCVDLFQFAIQILKPSPIAIIIIKPFFKNASSSLQGTHPLLNTSPSAVQAGSPQFLGKLLPLISLQLLPYVLYPFFYLYFVQAQTIKSGKPLFILKLIKDPWIK